MEEKYQPQRETYELIKGIEEPTIKAIADWVGGILSAVDEGKPIIYNQFTFWADSMVAMDLQALVPEFWPVAGRVAETLAALGGAAEGAEPEPEYAVLDAAEELGVPPEVCVAGRGVIGALLLDTMPPPSMIVVPSYPCDNTKAAYQIIAQISGAPMYLLDCPYWMDEEGAMDYWVNQYKGLISFMEEHSGKKLDYDRLKEVAEESNRFIEYWLEAEELMKMKPLPQNGPFPVPEILTKIGLPIATEAVKTRLDALKALVANGETAVPEETVRVIWNYLPVLWDTELFNWMAAEFGAVIPSGMTSWSWMLAEPIDTSTPESIIRGMARRAANGYMGRQGRGAADIWIEDTLNAFEQWSGDCIIVHGALGCKWLRGSYGYLRDICRQRGIPVTLFDCDIGDRRVVPQEEVHARIGEFIETVMAR